MRRNLVREVRGRRGEERRNLVRVRGMERRDLVRGVRGEEKEEKRDLATGVCENGQTLSAGRVVWRIKWVRLMCENIF